MNQGFCWGGKQATKRDVLVLKDAMFRLSSNNFQIAKSLPMGKGHMTLQ